MKICAFYQTFVPIPDSVYKKINRIIVSSFHFNKSCICSPTLHLNDDSPYSPKFSDMWKTMERLYVENYTDILINLGGAGGGITEMFDTNYDKAVIMLGELAETFPFIEGVVIDSEFPIDIKKIQRLVTDLKKITLDVYFAPVISALLNPTFPGMGGFSYDNFKESQNTVSGFFVQCYSDSYFSGDTYKQVLENFSGFNTLTFGILPDTVPLKDLKNRVKDLEDSGCREVYIWELGESGAIDVINNL